MNKADQIRSLERFGMSRSEDVLETVDAVFFARDNRYAGYFAITDKAVYAVRQGVMGMGKAKSMERLPADKIHSFHPRDGERPGEVAIMVLTDDLKQSFGVQMPSSTPMDAVRGMVVYVKTLPDAMRTMNRMTAVVDANLPEAEPFGRIA